MTVKTIQTGSGVSERDRSGDKPKKLTTRKKERESEAKLSPKTQFVKGPVPPQSPIEAWEDEDGLHYMSRYDVLRIESLRKERELQLLSARLLSVESDKLEQATVMKVRQMRAQASTITKRVNEEIEAEYQVLLAQLGEKYGVNFRDVGYDDASGRLTTLLK